MKDGIRTEIASKYIFDLECKLYISLYNNQHNKYLAINAL